MLKVAESTLESQPGERARSRKPFRRLTLVALACVAVLAAVAGGLYWQATRASISIGYLSDQVEAALSDRLPADASVAVGSTAFSYREGRGAILKIRDLHLVLPGTATVIVGELSTVTTASALVSGRIDLRSVTIAGVDIEVSALPAAESVGSGADLARRLTMDFIDQVIEADDLIRGAGLNEVVVNEATIRLHDQAAHAGPMLRIGEANWLPLSAERSKAWLQIVGEAGAGWDLTVERFRTELGNAVVNLEFEDVPIAALAPQLARGENGPQFQSGVTLQTRMARSDDGRFLGLRGILSATDGKLSLTGEDEINIASAALTFTLEETGDRLAIPSGEVRTNTGHVAFEGVADLAEAGHMTVVARIREGTLATPIGADRAVQLIGGGGVARVDFADMGVEVERLQVVTPNGTASAIGQASIAGQTPGLSFALSLSAMPAATARALWPPFVAKKLRRWFDGNVTSGVLGPATLQVALPPENIGPANRGKVLPQYALVGTLPFRDAVFSPIRTFPLIEQAAGQVSFANATASIVAESGLIPMAEGPLLAAGTTLIVPELGRLQPRGDLHLELSGPAAALATLSNTAPLSIARERGIVAADVTGDSTLALDANIPLDSPDFTDVIPSFRLELADFSSASPIDGRSVEEANLVLEGSARSYTVRGEGVLDGYRVSVDLIEGSAAPDQSAVIVTLDDAARERMGIGFGELVTGPVQAYVMTTGELGQQIALDLKQARINLPFLGWEKGPGVPATASFVMEETQEGKALSRFLLSGRGFEARGALTIGHDGRLKAMNLERVSLRAGDRLTATVTANGGGYDVAISGGVLDARGLIASFGAGALGGGADVFPVRVSLDIDVVRGRNDVALTDVSGNLTVTQQGLDAVALKGNANDSQPFDFTLSRDGNTRALRIFANAGGALIRFAGIYSRVAGGNLVLDYSGTVGGSGSGVLVMRDFRVVNEAAFSRVLEPSSPRAGMVHAYSPTANDLQFSQLRLPFTQEGWVITIGDAALRGASVGATAGGTINIPDGKMVISGTLIPAFGLNNIAGSIPLLGAILGGGRDEGLVGITYKLFGPLDNPELTVNPISAIAPGIFRKIFEYR